MFLAPGFGLAKLWLLWPFGEGSNAWEFFFLLSWLPYLSNT